VKTLPGIVSQLVHGVGWSLVAAGASMAVFWIVLWLRLRDARRGGL
jgi:hypothetical protein